MIKEKPVMNRKKINNAEWLIFIAEMQNIVIQQGMLNGLTECG